MIRLAFLILALPLMAVWDNVAKRMRKGTAAAGNVEVASASRASGNSGALDGSDAFALDALIDVTVAPGTSLTITVEESTDGTGAGLGAWTAVGGGVTQNTIGQNRIRALLTRRFYRYVWVVVGGNPTFSISADKKGTG